MRIAIRTDGGCAIGGGHVHRCLALAKRLLERGHEVKMVVRRTDAVVLSWITDAGLTVEVLDAHVDDTYDGEADAGATIAALDEWRLHWLVWDHYQLDASFSRKVRSIVPSVRILAIDDLGDRPLGCDMLLDQTRPRDATRAKPSPVVLAGPTYALVDSAFTLECTEPVRDGRRVLVAPGAGDVAGIVPAIITALGQCDELALDVVLSAMAANREQVEAAAAAIGNCTIHLDANDMPALMRRADLCIGAGGMSAWERCCCGLPSIVVEVATNQRPAIAMLVEAGAAIERNIDQIRDADALRADVLHLLDDQAIRADMAAKGRALCDGGGANRVIDCLESHLRPFTREDARMLFDWRDAPHVRSASLDRSPLEWDAHCTWLEGVLERTDGRWCVYGEAGRDLGVVHAVDNGDGTWQWGFHVGATDAPPGTGSRMTAAFLSMLFRLPDVCLVGADVREENDVSRRLHERLGFELVESQAEVLRMALDRNRWLSRFHLELEPCT